MKGALVTRAFSSLFLAVPVIAAVYFGTPYFEGMVFVAAAIMVWVLWLQPTVVGY